MGAKVLVIRFSSIGDIVLTTPVIRCLKTQMEDVEIHYITKEKYKEILAANPYIDQLHCIKSSIDEISDNLKNEHFDYVIDLHNNLRSSQLKRKLKMLSFKIDKLNIEKWLLVNFKIDKLPDKHIVDRYLETVKALGLDNDGEGLDYFIPEKDVVATSIFPKTFANGYVAFAIGGTYTTKKMPIEKIISVCKKIERPVVLLGGKEDAGVGHKIKALCGEDVYNACGSFSINQSASIIEQAQSVITHDTGMMHIAAALNKKIISVWGNTVPKFGMYPYLKKDSEINSTIVEVDGLKCRPCTKLGYSKCPKKHFYCMDLIDEQEIIEAATQW